jgi:hypothetical protein
VSLRSIALAALTVLLVGSLWRMVYYGNYLQYQFGWWIHLAFAGLAFAALCASMRMDSSSGR